MQPKRAFTQHAIAFAVAAAFQPQLFAQTMPSGGQVAAGQATISQPAPGYMQIDQASDKAILNWQSFSIGSGGQVYFQQPATSSVALNRVLGNNPSQIFGNLGANGRVFLVNPSGILFGPGSSVNVGALVASTLSITDQDFLDGRYVFSNAGGAGSVVNQGSINSFSGYTALLAPQVTNEGFIFANMGNVALAAGDRVSLDMVGDNLIRVSVDQAALDAAIVNRGNIEAFGGNVLLAAHSANALLDTVLNTQGFVRAARMIEQGGEIVLDGGSRGAMTIGGQLTSDGHMRIAGADMTVTGYAWSMRGQDVAARSLSIIGREGAVASLSNQGGEQTIAIAGDGSAAGLDLIVDGGLAAQIQQFDAAYAQTITVIDADHINVDVRAAAPGPFPAQAGIFTPGAQSVSITGTGRNAITVGSHGATGGAAISAGGAQSITASSLRLQSALSGATGGAFVSAFEQNIDVSGDIEVAGGSGTNNGAGIHSFGALQSIRASNLALQGGFGGANSGAFVNGVGQDIDVSGDITVAGGSGTNNGAGVHSLGALQAINASNLRLQGAFGGANSGAFVNGAGQVIEVGGEIVIAGGSGTNNGGGINSTGVQTILGRPDITVTSGVSNFATINAGPGALQTIEARNIRLSNSSGAGNSAAVIQGTHQQIDASGDVTLTAHAAAGDLAGARIGGASGSSTDLHLRLDGDLVLTGGSAGQNGASLGGSATGAALASHIEVRAGGDVLLDGATGGAGVRIGVSERVGIADGDISITGRSIAFTGSAPAVIRTLGNVELNAGTIAQGANGLILANALTTSSEGSTLLGGSNNVSSFSGSAGGDLLLRNLSSFLTLGPADAAGALSIDQAGSLLIQATDAPLVVRGGLVSVATGGDLRLAGGDADGAHALLSSGGNIDLAVGGTLRLDEGAGKFSWARVQTDSKDAVISLAFPNLGSGGFYVNGAEGDTKDGKSGFFIFHKPAKIGSDLLLEYGP